MADGAGRRSPDRTDRDGGGMPELPEDLFDWPDSVREPRPWNRSPGEQRRVREERGEDADPEDPESPRP